MDNEATFTEDEIENAAHSARFSIKQKLVKQYAKVCSLKDFILSCEEFNPIAFGGDVFSSDYTLFTLTCPKAWKEFEDAWAKKSIEYFEKQKQKEAARTKLSWFA